jgi:polyisoprenoid-binding protein YceI
MKILISLVLASFMTMLGTNILAPVTISKSESSLAWKAKKVTGEHFGNIQLSDAKLDYQNNRIVGGSFVIDMTTIVVEDIKDEGSNKRLRDHLNSDDFFSVEKFKSASFKITEAKSSNGSDYQITGDLTIKGITQSVTFPAKVSKTGNKITTTANIIFDRTKFDIQYRSGNYFENLADRLIYDDVEMEVKLVAIDA